MPVMFIAAFNGYRIGGMEKQNTPQAFEEKTWLHICWCWVLYYMDS